MQTNRVFLFLNHQCGHQWTKRLDEPRMMMGSGKRQVTLLLRMLPIVVAEQMIHLGVSTNLVYRVELLDR